MSLPNEIVLRPRFKFDVNHQNQVLLELFEATKTAQKDFIVTRIDDHVFIKIPKAKQHFWSPQLHLEIIQNQDDNDCVVHGLFGPSPTVWTLFIFLHFFVACLFIGFGIWAYTSWSLGNNSTLQVFGLLFMIVIWVTLYFAGRIGKTAGTDEMYELHHFMRDTLRSKDIHATIH